MVRKFIFTLSIVSNKNRIKEKDGDILHLFIWLWGKNMSIKKNLIILIVLMMIIVTGCGLNKQANGISKKAGDTINKSYEGAMIGLTDESSITDDQLVYKISNKEAFSPTITIGNLYKSNNRYRLLFLLDYKQTKVLYDNKEQKVINIDLPPKSQKKIEIKVPNLEDGSHDFLLLVIRDPDTILKVNKYIPPEEVFMKRRAIIIVNKEKEKQINYNMVNSTLNKNTDELNKNAFNAFISLNQGKDLSESLAIIDEKKAKNVWLNIPNYHNNSKFAIIAFAGDEQIKLDNPFVESSTTGLLHIPFELPNFNKNEDLVVTVVENPFQSPLKDGKKTLIPWQVRFTNKITIQD